MVENIRSKQAHMTLNAPQFQVTISCEERVLFGFPCFEKQDAERCVCGGNTLVQRLAQIN